VAAIQYFWRRGRILFIPHGIVVPYELYELYDWGKVPELYGTIRILHFAEDSVKWTTDNAEETDSESDSCSDSE